MDNPEGNTLFLYQKQVDMLHNLLLQVANLLFSVLGTSDLVLQWRYSYPEEKPLYKLHQPLFLL